MPERFTFPITATAADIDELGHVSNLVYLRWVLDVAMAHSQALGWGHAEYRAHGAIFVVRRHEIDYLAQVTEGQQLIGTTWVESWKAASCIRKTELWLDGRGLPPAVSASEGKRGLIDGRGLPPAVSASEGKRGLIDGQPVARASTVWAFMSLASGRPTRIPEEIIALFA